MKAGKWAAQVADRARAAFAQCLIPGQLLSKREKEERESKLYKGTGLQITTTLSLQQLSHSCYHLGSDSAQNWPVWKEAGNETCPCSVLNLVMYQKHTKK